MNICVIGTGYVGLTAGTCFAQAGSNVICVDKDVELLEKLEKGIIPIYETSLEELIKSNVQKKRLKFTNDLKSAVEVSQICFIAVGTPQNDSGSADLRALFGAVEETAQYINGYKIIVNKSTAPVGTTEKIAQIIRNITNHDFDTVSNPEFLKQGCAVNDFLKPDRVIIGSDSQKAADIMKKLYSSFLKPNHPIMTMDTKSAEMTKYAANSFLAVKISFANEIANICEKVGADAKMVREGICSDKRIGAQFLFEGLGYGGSCFPKDVKAIVKTAKDHNCGYSLLEAADKINTKQRLLFVRKVTNRFGEDLSGKTFALWGLAFKPKTDDMREAPSITVIEELLRRGAAVNAFDPKAMPNAKKIFGGKIEYAKNIYEALKAADCLLLLTEWAEFKHPDFKKIKSLLKYPIIFDGRNQYNADELALAGFEYYCIGKSCQISPETNSIKKFDRNSPTPYM